MLHELWWSCEKFASFLSSFFRKVGVDIFLWGSGEFQIHRDKFERSDPGSQWFHVFFFSNPFRTRKLKPWNLMKKHEKTSGPWNRVIPCLPAWVIFSRGRWVAILMWVAHENELAALSTTELARSIGAGANGLCIYMLGGCYPSLRTLGPRHSAKNRLRVSCQQLQVNQPFGPSFFWTPGIPNGLPNSPFVYLLFTGKTVAKGY